MSRVAVPVTFLAMILAVLLWAAGVVPAPLLWRVEIGLAAALLFAAALAAWREILRKRKYPGITATVAAARAAGEPAGYLVGTAVGYIHPGDTVKIDTKTWSVTAIPPTGEPVQ